jgi:uncharacterized sporulation protein YeaH/YhbH (DUF444 family)
MGKQGKDVVSIPVPQIDIPRFRYSDKQGGGVGQGEGDEGDPIGGEEGQDGDGKGKAGQNEGQHASRWRSRSTSSPTSSARSCSSRTSRTRARARSSTRRIATSASARRSQLAPPLQAHLQAGAQRQISTGTYDPKNPMIIPTRDDMRYRSWKTEEEPIANAVIIYMMDVSGSMGDEQKEIVRIESFWIDTWLRKQYKGIETRFIIHDAVAREVDRDTFFRRASRAAP